jgi:tripartite-type tricarboxylate transporter receptor subunit TctC
VQDGKLRGLAVASGKRLLALPDVPTMAQAGYPDITVEFWIGIFAPTGTPADIVTLLNREVEKAVALPDVKQRLDALGFEAAAIKLADSGAKLRSESEKWGKVVKAAGIKVE